MRKSGFLLALLLTFTRRKKLSLKPDGTIGHFSILGNIQFLFLKIFFPKSPPPRRKAIDAHDELDLSFSEPVPPAGRPAGGSAGDLPGQEDLRRRLRGQAGPGAEHLRLRPGLQVTFTLVVSCSTEIIFYRDVSFDHWLLAAVTMGMRE